MLQQEVHDTILELALTQHALELAGEIHQATPGYSQGELMEKLTHLQAVAPGLMRRNGFCFIGEGQAFFQARIRDRSQAQGLFIMPPGQLNQGRFFGKIKKGEA